MASLPAHSDTVLVVDDEPDTLRMLTAMLEAADLTVLIANSGKAALDILEHITPDLVLMDAVMPGMDGFETTVRIKRNPALAHIPVIFMTGLVESEHVVEAFEVGGVDYVRKPVCSQELLARVRVHIAHGRAVHASVASLEATGRMMLATNASGSLLWCTPLAECAIFRFTPGWSKEENFLPSLLRNGIERLLAREEVGGASIRIEQPQGSLELVVVAHFRDDELLIRLNELNPERDIVRLRSRLNLTQREAEVLLWLSYGKSNLDISSVLDISPRTVQKHLEHVYVKLGVETRASAVAIATRMLGQ